MDDSNLFSSFTDVSNWYGNHTKEMVAANQFNTSQASKLGPITPTKMELKGSVAEALASYNPCSPPVMDADEGVQNWRGSEYTIEQALSSAFMGEGLIQGWNPGYLTLAQLATEHSSTCLKAHGQITPPNDLSPETHRSPEAVKQEADSPEQTTVKSGRSQKATRRRKATSKVDEDSVAPPAKKQRKRRNAPQIEAEAEVVDSAQRERYLEKNRIAASKCRQKKKMWELELDAQVKELSAARASLRPCVTALREEVIELKNELLKHADCGCTAIHEYLSRSATHILPSTSFGSLEIGVGTDRTSSVSFHGGFMAATDALDIG